MKGEKKTAMKRRKNSHEKEKKPAMKRRKKQ